MIYSDSFDRPCGRCGETAMNRYVRVKSEPRREDSFVDATHPVHYMLIDNNTGKLMRASCAEAIALRLMGCNLFRYTIIKVPFGTVHLRCAEYNQVVKQLEEAR